MRRETHYEVRWRLYTSPTDFRANSSVKLPTLEAARVELRRLAERNEMFLEVDGFAPYRADFTIWKVETTVETTRVETEVGNE